MKVVECEQGSPEWIEARLGIPTASEFSRIITPGTGKLSKSADGYVNELLAEYLLGFPVDGASSSFMERGIELETEAYARYEFEVDVDTQQVGFVLRDDGLVGCSPDRLVGDTGGLELKTPAVGTHVGYLLDGPAIKYYPQVQGCIWICEREWFDLMSYNPELPPAIVRVTRDDGYIKKLEALMAQFCEWIAERKLKLEKAGIERKYPRLHSFS